MEKQILLEVTVIFIIFIDMRYVRTLREDVTKRLDMI